MAFGVRVIGISGGVNTSALWEVDGVNWWNDPAVFDRYGARTDSRIRQVAWSDMYDDFVGMFSMSEFVDLNRDLLLKHPEQVPSDAQGLLSFQLEEDKAFVVLVHYYEWESGL